ncbi:cation diffusion facilitator family transporter [Syntrophomonas palmitatica]|uniref:cation diffusion facilitator family transporter n=1 Tax=Syntrophomonas palmitatica TaxID=402877 RepID=UPI0006D0B5A6|nr:cation diffusion facilitator family transporter [Syntrophomonas palmitatica]
MKYLVNKIAPDEKSKIALLSIVSNTTLVALKLAAGIVTGSVSIVSEAIHSGLDLLAAIIAFVSVRVSGRPPDQKHQYGHGKFENLSGTIEAILIFIAAVWIIIEAYDKLINKAKVETLALGIIVMGVSALVNTIISAILMKTAKKTRSVALEADAMHLRTDVYTSVGVLAGLAAIQLTGIQILDPIIAIGVAVLIIKAAYDLTAKAFRPLLDIAVGKDEAGIINEVLQSMVETNLLGYHKLRTRQSGPERHLDMHLVVPRDMTVKEAHDLAHRVEDQLKTRLPHSIILIHTEPCVDSDCSVCRGCEKKQFSNQDDN